MPLVHRILRLEEPTKKHHIAAVVIAPTRELAIQIHKTLTDLVAFHPASVAVAPYLSSDDEKRPSMYSKPVLSHVAYLMLPYDGCLCLITNPSRMSVVCSISGSF